MFLSLLPPEVTGSFDFPLDFTFFSTRPRPLTKTSPAPFQGTLCPLTLVPPLRPCRHRAPSPFYPLDFFVSDTASPLSHISPPNFFPPLAPVRPRFLPLTLPLPLLANTSRGEVSLYLGPSLVSQTLAFFLLRLEDPFVFPLFAIISFFFRSFRNLSQLVLLDRPPSPLLRTPTRDMFCSVAVPVPT